MPKEKWNKQFSENQFTYGKTVNAFIREKSHLFSPHSNLACFAEGEGRNAVFLANAGHHIIAYDVSSIGLKHAKILAEENDVPIETVEADLTEFKVEKEKYDGAIMVFGHVEKEKQEFLIKNIIDAVKSGGYVLFEVYSEDQLKYDTGGPGNKQFLYRPMDILKWIAPYTCIHFYYGEANRKEGYRHTGLGHVIQVAIQK